MSLHQVRQLRPWMWKLVFEQAYLGYNASRIGLRSWARCIDPLCPSDLVFTLAFWAYCNKVPQTMYIVVLESEVGAQVWLP